MFGTPQQAELMSLKHIIVTESEWLQARREFLKKEKAFTRARDELNAARRELPWTPVAKDYRFEGAQGEGSAVSE